jgi:hypothetical protein
MFGPSAVNKTQSGGVKLEAGVASFPEEKARGIK